MLACEVTVLTTFLLLGCLPIRLDLPEALLPEPFLTLLLMFSIHSCAAAAQCYDNNDLYCG